LIFAVSFIYILGLIWLGILIGWEKPLFKIGAQPFLLAELFKILILVFLSPALSKFKNLRKII
jgi:biotin transport system substrate-specific component